MDSLMGGGEKVEKGIRRMPSQNWQIPYQNSRNKREGEEEERSWARRTVAAANTCMEERTLWRLTSKFE